MLTLIVKMELLRFRDADLIDLFLSRDDDFLTYAIRQISQKKKKKKREKKEKYEKNVKFEVPPRFELGLLDSESNVLTTRPWDLLVIEKDFLLYNFKVKLLNVALHL